MGDQTRKLHFIGLALPSQLKTNIEAVVKVIVLKRSYCKIFPLNSISEHSQTDKTYFQYLQTHRLLCRLQYQPAPIERYDFC